MTVAGDRVSSFLDLERLSSRQKVVGAAAVTRSASAISFQSNPLRFAPNMVQLSLVNFRMTSAANNIEGAESPPSKGARFGNGWHNNYPETSRRSGHEPKRPARVLTFPS